MKTRRARRQIPREMPLPRRQHAIAFQLATAMPPVMARERIFMPGFQHMPPVPARRNAVEADILSQYNLSILAFHASQQF